MIGVIARDTEAAIVGEFFELFKTAWQFYDPAHDYEAVIVTTTEVPASVTAKLLLIYNSGRTWFDEVTAASYEAGAPGQRLQWNGAELPTYLTTRVFEPDDQADDQSILCIAEYPETSAGFSTCRSGVRVVRIGYDLFQEFTFLLTRGQPPEHAHIPTAETHIALLRECLAMSNIPFAEIPAAPSGYQFMAGLTHDVDFVGIRQHRFDRTLMGFLCRATAGSLYQALRGRLTWRKALRNWKAVLSLPLVHLGLLPDFWLEFDRYTEIEKDLGSTFFFIPYKDRPGRHLTTGNAPQLRAVRYDLTEVQEDVRDLVKKSCEIGLHGIDAWSDPQKAHNEAERIQQVTGQPDIGVRMHWLYFSDQSPRFLREAGCSYDSTFGYNDAVGFRAGTGQVFCIPASGGLLELPMTIQDTALFYRGRMCLSETEAMNRCEQVLGSMRQFGGALTLNWHTRSLSPERLWGDFYIDLLQRIRRCSVCFGTASQIVNWFKARRAVTFECVEFADRCVRVKLAGTAPVGQAPMVVRIYHPKLGSEAGTASSASVLKYIDMPWNGEELLQSTI
jgi:hypothetical protein